MAPYMAGELPREQIAAIAAHLPLCPGCAAEHKMVKAASRLLRSSAPRAIEPADDLWRKVAARLPEQRRASAPVWRWAVVAPLAVAVLIIAIMAGPMLHQAKAPVTGTNIATVPRTNIPTNTAKPTVTPTPAPVPTAPEDGGKVAVAPPGSHGTHMATYRTNRSGHRAPAMAIARNTSKVKSGSHEPVNVPFATEEDRIARGMASRAAWANSDQTQKDKAAKEEARSLFSY